MRKAAFAFSSVTFAAVASWGTLIAAIWLPVDARALPLVRAAATVSAVALMLMLSLRWLRSEGMGYLLNAMIRQRAKPRARDHCAPTFPMERPR